MVAERKGEQRPSPPLPLPVHSNIQREFRLPLSPSPPSPMRNEMRISQPKETTKAATEEDDLI